ncbi:hypothetical protein L289_4066 [Acinetobacter gerneri DSM 14967 = CIP 107464 = MTCC 9824]|uniref:Alpha/beta hydrolase n=2 Tax=Acinetobacter gerneri TaxID=202952 RepID=N8Y633_9GAMM|nr:hypothetical protein F960_03600 [Acinetobacter gerneri DSM 14967 = CIP 107464 = MTCC 9824]EPR81022.1 hypothetical protein L289_4066 [Acinetobacter gerneri DSM 14967 = CIP 107464 = MTCC 9824]
MEDYVLFYLCGTAKIGHLGLHTSLHDNSFFECNCAIPQLFGVSMEKKIIFEDEQIRAIYLQGSSETLVLSFGDLITRAKGTSINAEKSLSKYDFNVIGIMPKQKSWYPESSMLALFEVLKPYLEQYSSIVGYGGSMGGYAVVKYAKLLKMTRAVAFVPQYSIDPEDVEDRRYSDFYDVELNRDMHIKSEDISSECEYIIVYDPYFENDRENYLKIKPLIPHLHTLNLPYSGHDAISVLASSALLNDFIRHPFDQTYFYKQMREVKKNNKFYYRNVIARLLGTHNEALGKILKSTDLQLDGSFFDNNLKQMITRILLTNKRVDEQDLMKLGISVNFPIEKKEQLQDYFGNFLVFNVITQKIESYSQQVIDINSKYLCAIQVKATGLTFIDLNKEDYFLAMNDRQVIKLFKQNDALSLDMSPIITKKYPEFYILSYKNLNLGSDLFGTCKFDYDSFEDNVKFILA